MKEKSLAGSNPVTPLGNRSGLGRAMNMTESFTSLGISSKHPKRPLANALFIQNLNPLKKKQQEEEKNKDNDDEDMIVGGGAKVSLTENPSSPIKDGSEIGKSSFGQ